VTVNEPGVIVVGGESLHGLLAGSGVAWNVQAHQPDTRAMWDALSGGRLDVTSRVLVFADPAAGDVERTQTARAVVAMAHAGAYVFVWAASEQAMSALDAEIRQAAVSQGVDAATLGYYRLPVGAVDGRVLEAMRPHVQDIAAFPAALTAEVDGFPGVNESMASVPLADVRLASLPELPPIGEAASGAESMAGYPPSASTELLSRPRLPGQVTITVTSSKGGSGKSTASLLLAGSIARASARAGRPLSVCVIDLDTRDGQVASLIGKFMPTALNIRVQPVWDEERIRRNLVHADGMDIETVLAPIRPRTAETVGPEFYQVLVRSLQRMFDVVIMDTSVQYLDPLISDVALKEADEILFVTTLASTAVQGMARALREITAPVDESGLGVPREKLGIIVNQSVAGVGMEREQVLAAGLGIPVAGVIPLATKDVLTATNLNRMHELLDHPLLGPAYTQLAQACLPGHQLAPWTGDSEPSSAGTVAAAPDDPPKKASFFRR